MVKVKYESFTLLTENEKKPGDRVWSVNCNLTGARTGLIMWTYRFDQLCFLPNDATCFSTKCLREIEDFIKKVSKK